MFRGLAAALLLVVGCQFSTTLEQQPDGHMAIDAAIDAKPLPVCANVPNGCTTFNCPSNPASCYYYCPSTETFGTSQNVCQNIPGGGGCLVTLSDAMESACITAAVGAGDLIYIGYRQAGGSPEPTGGWDWQCPSSTYGPNWSTGEPNDSGLGGEDCSAMGTNGKWVDVGCSEQFRFVCEKPRPAISAL